MTRSMTIPRTARQDISATLFLYRITQGNACFGVEVEAGVVTRAAPIVGAILGRFWADVRGQFRNAELVAPTGWEIQEGARGWRGINGARLWSTSVHPTPEEAVGAAVDLEKGAALAIERVRRLCEGLRECFGQENDYEARR